MKLRRYTINLTEDQSAILDEVQRRERYRSPSEVFQSCLRHWALTQQEHSLTGPYASLPGAERDAIDAGLRQMVESGKGKKGSWLKAIIYDAIKEAHGADAKAPTIDQVLRVLPDVVKKKITGGK